MRRTPPEGRTSGAPYWVVDQLSKVGDAEPTSVYVAVTDEPPAVETTVTVPGWLFPFATSSISASSRGWV